MSSRRIVGSIICGTYVATRFGVFGKHIVQIDNNDFGDVYTNAWFWSTASWHSYDYCVRISTWSLRPISFERPKLKI